MSTATITPSPASTSPADVIAWQRERIRAGAVEVLGKIWMITLEAAKDAQIPSRPVANTLGSRIEFYNEHGGPEVVGPRIGQTGAKGSLLILDPLVRSDGQVGLPNIPDPAWIPPIPTNAQLTSKNYRPATAPMIPQRLVDQGDGFGGRARGVIRAGTSTYYVCGPVSQIVVRPLDKEMRILPNGLIFKALPSSPVPGATSTVMEMLVDAQSGESFLFGGRFEIVNPG